MLHSQVWRFATYSDDLGEGQTSFNFRPDIGQVQRVVIFHDSQVTSKNNVSEKFQQLLARLVPCSRIAMSCGLTSGLRLWR